jgi:hypothetical protein
VRAQERSNLRALRVQRQRVPELLQILFRMLLAARMQLGKVRAQALVARGWSGGESLSGTLSRPSYLPRSATCTPRVQTLGTQCQVPGNAKALGSGCSLRWASGCGRACSPSFGRLRAPGPSTPDAAPERAARGGGSNGVFRRDSARSNTHSSTARACCRFESRRVAHAPRQPGRSKRSKAGDCHGASAVGWHDSNRQQDVVSESQLNALGALGRSRSRYALRTAALGSATRSPAGVVFGRQVEVAWARACPGSLTWEAARRTE